MTGEFSGASTDDRGCKRVQTWGDVPEDDGGEANTLARSDLANLDAVLGHEIAENTRRSYETQWRRFVEWAQEKRVPALPADPTHVAVYLAERLEVHGHRPATLRAAASAVSYAHRAADLDDPCASLEVKTALKSAARKAGRDQRQAEALTSEALQKIRETALLPRPRVHGRMESTQAAARRGLVDVAMMSLMRDAMLRVSEAAAVRWGDLRTAPDGTGRLVIRRSKTDAEGETVVLFVSRPTMDDLEAMRAGAADDESMFGLGTNQIARRIKSAARAAGLGEGFSGHSPRVGMAQDLARAGTELPRLMTAGRWRSPRMPAHYIRNETAARGAVAQYYGTTMEFGPVESPMQEHGSDARDGLQEPVASCKIQRRDDEAITAEIGVKSPIKATISDTLPSSILTSESPLGGEKRDDPSAASSGTEGCEEQHRSSLITDTSRISRRVFKRHPDRLFALNRTFGTVHHQVRPFFRACEAVDAHPVIRFLSFRFLLLAICIVAAGEALSFLNWNETWVPAVYVSFVVGLVVAQALLFKDREAPLREFFWVSVFLMLCTPMLQFVPIGMDQYGFYRVGDYAGTHMPYMLTLLLNLVLASSAGLMFHVLIERLRASEDGDDGAVRRTIFAVIAPLAVVYGVVLVVSNASLWIQLGLQMPALAVAFTMLLVLRDPKIEFDDKERQFLLSATLAAVALCLSLGMITILAFYVSPGLTDVFPDHNLLCSWQIDFAEAGFAKDEALERLRLGFLWHAAIMFPYLSLVVGGNVVVAVFRMGGGNAKRTASGISPATATETDTAEGPETQKQNPEHQRFSLAPAGAGTIAR